MIKVNLNKEAFQIALARRNLTQRALALDMHTNPHYLTEIVTGRRSLSPYMRQRLLEYFKGCKFDDLFVIEENGNGARR